jgi:hypothetical protein
MNNSSGDIIFLSDQDDIWPSNRVEKMLKVMMKNPKIMCLVGLVNTIDDMGNPIPLHISMEKSKNSDVVNKIPFKKSLKGAAGCCMAVRAEIANLLTRINDGNCAHDWQVAIASASMDGLYKYDRVVTIYRIHEVNTSGIREKVLFGNLEHETRKVGIERQKRFLELLLSSDAESRKISIETTDSIHEMLDLVKSIIVCKFLSVAITCIYDKVL